MKVVILGAGRRGLRLAKHLIEENKDVTIIDADPERCDQATAKLDCLAINGSGTNPDILRNAGCEDADIFISLTDSDEVNLVSCAMVSSQFKGPRTVAAIRSMSYTGTELTAPLLGIDYIVNPFEEVAKAVSEIVKSGLFLNASTFPNTPFLVCSIPVKSDSAAADKTLMQVRNEFATQFVVAGIGRGSKAFLPDGKTVIKEGDNLAIITSKDQMADLLSEFDAKMSRPHRICLIGAGRIARFMMQMLPLKTRKAITVIDKDNDHCDHFSQMYPETLVIKGNITEEAIWEDENLADYDLLISLTDNDELNIIMSAYGKRIGIPHTIALVKTNPNYVSLGRHFDIDTIISTTEVTIDTLLRYIRGENIESLHSLFQGKIEVSEYTLLKDSSLLGRPLKEFPFAGKLVVTGVTDKDGKSFLANGNYIFHEGDTVLVTVPHDHIDLAQEAFS